MSEHIDAHDADATTPNDQAMSDAAYNAGKPFFRQRLSETFTLLHLMIGIAIPVLTMVSIILCGWLEIHDTQNKLSDRLDTLVRALPTQETLTRQQAEQSALAARMNLVEYQNRASIDDRAKLHDQVTQLNTAFSTVESRLAGMDEELKLLVGRQSDH